MDKDVSFFISLNDVDERKIYVFDDFTLDIANQSDVSSRHGRIVKFYHVPNLSANLFSIDQLTQTSNIVKFWSDWFFIHDLKKGQSIIIGGFLDSKDNLYKFCEMT